MKKLLLLAFLLCSALAVANIVITRSTSDPSPASAGDELYLKVLLQNNAEDEATNVSAEITAEDPFVLKVAREQTQSMDMLCKYCYAEVEYHFSVKPSAQSGQYPLKYKVSFTDQQTGVKKFVENDIYLTVRNYQHTIGISSVKVSKTPLSPGDKAQVELTVRNYGVEPIKQIELTLTSPEGIDIIGSTKRYFLTPMNGGDEMEVTYDIIVDQGAKMMAYKFPLIVKITDNFGNEQFFNDTIGIDVQAQPGVTLQVRSFDPLKGVFSVLVANRGNAQAKYTIVSVSGVKTDPVEAYLGNLDPDDYSTADFKFKEQGTAKITVSYFDADNVEKTSSQTLDVYVVRTDNNWLYGVGAIALLVVIYLIFFRKKNNNK